MDRPYPSLRPQSLMLTFLGNCVLRREIAVFSGSFIEVFGRLGVGEHAIRSTLTRMARHGMLARHRRGRRMHFGLTARSERILLDGEARVLRRGAVNAHWDGGWTVLSFSMPESWQRQRHDLRSRLVWAGFGPLGNGTWIAPSRVDVTEVISPGGADLGLAGRVKVFHGTAEEPTDVSAMIRDAFDLEGLAAGYRSFLERWDRPEPVPGAPDDLVRFLWLMTQWLGLVRVDPGLPVQHLPPGWPALRAQEVLHELRGRYEDSARAIADEIIEYVPVACPATAGAGRDAAADH
ncbi:PaaX family transcriptional regulator C-terminal domain-containing protein [Actinomadura sp. SCN-SB]|uniref:PaaX family transcriptional regulator n=1 Tax=Actinomadura sp. SCN-SB TaxID=3373092 RepID=UPI003752A0D0